MTELSYFTKKLEKPDEKPRDSLINAIANRSYCDEQGVLVSNGLSTELICFPSDLTHKKELLGEKIKNAISYATSFIDVETINALQCISPKNPVNGYLALGLYLYFADEFSRLKRDTTVLSAMREKGVALKAGDTIDKPFLFQKIKEAICLNPEHERILQEWYSKGTYTIEGELNRAWTEKEKEEEKHFIDGSYVELAYEVSLQQTLLGMNKAISYALGNIFNIRDLTPQEALEYTQNILKEPKKIKNIVDSGDKKRVFRITKIIFSTPELKTDKKPEQNSEIPDKQIKSILSHLPDYALEILYREGYALSCINDKDIIKAYPQADVPGISKEENEISRKGKALRQPRYKTIFLSNGNRDFGNISEPKNTEIISRLKSEIDVNHIAYENNEDIKHDSKKRSLIAAQSLAHETMHIMLSYLDASEKNDLKNKIESLSAEMKKAVSNGFNRQLETINTNTLQEVVDIKSGHYENYTKDTALSKPWEEMLCNFYGLMNSEYIAKSNSPNKLPVIKSSDGERIIINNPFILSDPFRKMEVLIDEIKDKALARCRKQHAHINMPQTTTKTIIQKQ